MSQEEDGVAHVVEYKGKPTMALWSGPDSILRWITQSRPQHVALLGFQPFPLSNIYLALSCPTTLDSTPLPQSN